MKNKKNGNSFEFKEISKEEMVNIINSKHPIKLNKISYFADKIHERYPVATKTEIVMVLKEVFETIREILVNQKLIRPVVFALHIVDECFVGYFIATWGWIVTCKIPIAFTLKIQPPSKPVPTLILTAPKNFKLGVIVGSSGSGKSTLLKHFGTEETPIWTANKAVISHFDSPDDGINRLSAVGFNSIPSWYKPYEVLSNGEKFRADLARKLKTGAVIDEYTSVVDRNVAKAASVALSKFIKNNDIENVVLSTCHYDIIDWLEPDWVLNTDTGELLNGFFLSVRQSLSKYIAQTMMAGECLKTITI